MRVCMCGAGGGLSELYKTSHISVRTGLAKLYLTDSRSGIVFDHINYTILFKKTHKKILETPVCLPQTVKIFRDIVTQSNGFHVTSLPMDSGMDTSNTSNGVHAKLTSI